ncbi:hypothetical protein DL769_005596 [Monosporascus sp. CRB-8-3]|nr:hypothetical protein DL769_005596 [Monosporascus sp. CRB-8-3]
MLDEDFNTQMATMAKNQQEANDAYARSMQRMAADLSDMCGRFEREMRAEWATMDGHDDDSGTRGPTVRGQVERGTGRTERGKGPRDVVGSRSQTPYLRIASLKSGPILAVVAAPAAQLRLRPSNKL